jgi:hypothetical protein
MIVCIFDHVQWIWALNDFTTHGYVAPYELTGRGAGAAQRGLEAVPRLVAHAWGDSPVHKQL